jgi:hypothetical protein
LKGSNDLRAWLVLLYGRFSSLSPSYLAREKIDGAPRIGVVQKPKIKIFWCVKNIVLVVFASRCMNYRLLRKKTEVFAHLLGTFLLFCGNNTKRRLGLLAAVTAQA